MASGTTQVQKTPGGQHDHAVAIGELVSVHLRLDVLHLHSAHLLQTRHVDLIVEMSNVAHNRIVLHLRHVRGHDDVLVSSGGHENVGLTDHVVQRRDLETLHARLQSADRIHLSDNHAGTSSAHGEGTALAHVSVPADHHTLASDHHIGGAHDAVRQRVPAPVHVVELRLCHAIVHVDRREKQLTLLRHLDETVHTSGCLLRHTPDSLRHAAPLRGILLDRLTEHRQHALELGVLGLSRIRKCPVLRERLLPPLSLVDQQRGIATIIDNHVRSVLARPGQCLLCAPPILLQSLTLPRKNRRSLSLRNRRRSMVLGRENVARAPPHCGAQCLQGLDQHTGLDGHVQRPGDVDTLQRLGCTILLPCFHQAGHLMLSQLQLLAPKFSQANILHLGVSHDGGREFTASLIPDDT
mmetsp:Transcript_3082/g.7336  ORF Transcript_3082/g.7336 Transcript_3082/m.7336 type:complete len:410 (-) Transcript_3082:35-1264(-)